MERSQQQENLSHLVNIEALIGKLSQKATSSSKIVSQTSSVNAENLVQLDINWPSEVLSSTLKSKLDRSEQPLHAINGRAMPEMVLSKNQTSQTRQLGSEQLDQILDLLVKDVMASRDRLLLLNPGRRKMIEHRLEFIARRIARSRGERLTRSLSLTEILKDSYRDNAQVQHKLGVIAWRMFAIEAALYHVLELFFLKCLDTYGWRQFSSEDLGRLNFAANSFLAQRATGFAHDRHCWNFVRSNVYSWYVPSQKALTSLASVLDNPIQLSWSDRDLWDWATNLPSDLKPIHLDFELERHLGNTVVDLLENQLGTPLVSRFHDQAVCKKFFFPAMELGGTSLALLDRLLDQVKGVSLEESSQLHRSIWGCESESFEVFWTEVMSLLKVLRTARGFGDSSGALCPILGEEPENLQRLPHAVHSVQMLGLELHNLEQLALEAPNSRVQQGSASQIQQLETFDCAVVTDHVDRMKSARFMKALADQLPYWRNLVSNGTNLNWGELHLYLALTKLKENGVCVYLSHKVLPEGGDGERLRRTILSQAKLEYFVELHEESHRPYRYLYIFRRSSNKLERDQHRPKFGRVRAVRAPLDLSVLEEANSTQSEIAERGWDHLFVRGAAPLVRHLNHKFPKLFQVTTIQTWHGPVDESTGSNPNMLFSSGAPKALEGTLHVNGEQIGGLQFNPLSSTPPSSRNEHLLVFPHNPVDLPWIQCLLNSAPAQFWIRHQILHVASPGKSPKLNDVRTCPIVDLSHAPADLVHEALEWLGETKPNATVLRNWACQVDLPLVERYAKFVALAKRRSQLERLVLRYRPLFHTPGFEQLRPEAITQFYPASLLCTLNQSPDVRVQYGDRTRSTLLPENWTVTDAHAVVQSQGNSTKPIAFVVVHTRQGPTIQLSVPPAVREYLVSQVQALRGHTWGELVTMLRIPRDIPLFSAQISEITQVVSTTVREMSLYNQVIDEAALDLFEIPTEMRQFLPH